MVGSGSGSGFSSQPWPGNTENGALEKVFFRLQTKATLCT